MGRRRLMVAVTAVAAVWAALGSPAAAPALNLDPTSTAGQVVQGGSSVAGQVVQGGSSVAGQVVQGGSSVAGQVVQGGSNVVGQVVQSTPPAGGQVLQGGAATGGRVTGGAPLPAPLTRPAGAAATAAPSSASQSPRPSTARPVPAAGSASVGSPGQRAATGAAPPPRARAGARTHPGAVATRVPSRPAAVRAGALTVARTDAPSGRARHPHRDSPGFVRSVVGVVPDSVKALIGLLALVAAGFALRSRLATRRTRRLERQRRVLLDDIGMLQRALLPEVAPRVGALGVSVGYRPAEGLAAGGDFYDVFVLDANRVAVIVGDVMGHGREALAVTALMRYSLRAYLGAGLEPRMALKVASHALAGDPDGELTTVVVCVHDARAGTLTYACAGHEHPIITGNAVPEPVTACSSVPLGGLLETGHRQTTVPFGAGARACLFTDGLVEARRGGGLLGRDTLGRLFAELDEPSADALIARVTDAADRTPDDMAACILVARDDARTPSAARVEELEIPAAGFARAQIERFLLACEVSPEQALRAIAAAQRLADEGSGSLVRVTVEAGATRVEVDSSAEPDIALPALEDVRASAQVPARS